jgi:hypothetical protein
MQGGGATIEKGPTLENRPYRTPPIIKGRMTGGGVQNGTSTIDLGMRLD